ncbi:MAG TPA: spermidine/putrescine ABC transporter substrate-binding protein, partial [Pseudoclavibacter sp.]|nr:spermidine/putrescine ABC transporter substrate-binding protein [Pseudoclavibacter sp.]
PTGILLDERSTSKGLDDMIFFTQDQVDKMQRLAITDANDRLLEIFNALQAAAG